MCSRNILHNTAIISKHKPRRSIVRVGAALDLHSHSMIASSTRSHQSSGQFRKHRALVESTSVKVQQKQNTAGRANFNQGPSSPLPKTGHLLLVRRKHAGVP